MEKPIVFKNNKNQQLVGILHRPKIKKKVPLVIVCHGFPGSKTRARFVKLGRRLAEEGIALLRFDYSGHGDSEGELTEFSVKQGLKDLKAAFQYAGRLNFIDKRKIGFLGESFGSILTSLFVLEHPQIKTVVFWAPALNQKKLMKVWYSPYDIRKWEKQGYFDDRKYRAGLKHLREIKNKDFSEEAVKLNIPVLIIHGTKDTAVPVFESKRLFKKIKRPKKLVIVKGGDHLLERYDIRQEVIRITTNWFKKHLK